MCGTCCGGCFVDLCLQVSRFAGTFEHVFETTTAGVTIQAYVGYFTSGNVANLTYTATPASITIANVPAAGCPTNTTSVAGTAFRGKPVCRINTTARITTDTHLTANNSYLLTGTAFFGTNTATPNASKTKLTIDAGTYIFAPTGSHNLVIDKSAMIFANGSASKPVIFTSELDNTTPGAGLDPVNSRSLWGGLALNGVARLNTASGFADGEGSTGQYGGGTSPNDEDSSGSMTYVQIKYAGVAFNELNELNTLSLQGVGRGTNLDFLPDSFLNGIGEDFYVQSNVSYIESEIQIGAANVGALTNSQRPLQGQSDWLYNLQVGYEPASGTTATLLITTLESALPK